jgi:endonuclease III
MSAIPLATAKTITPRNDAMGHAIKTIGLYRTKAKNVIGLSEQLIENHGGEVPRDHEALEALPGVGRKTANVVLNMAFGEPTIAVDTHLFRVGNRTGLAVGKTPLEVELKLLEVVPGKYLLHAHHWLILFGRYTCIARRPLCEKCIIADLCKWPGQDGECGGGRLGVIASRAKQSSAKSGSMSVSFQKRPNCGAEAKGHGAGID